MFDFKPIKNLEFVLLKREFVLLIFEIIKPSMIYYCYYYYLALCSSAFIALWIDMMTMG